MSKQYYIYILSNFTRSVFYTGVTNNVSRRVWEHKEGYVKGFTEKYNIRFLMYVETYPNIYDAIHREKLIKKYKREWKINLIRSINPEMKDIYYDLI